jgi:SAM-dependent methyltransferase
MDMMNMKFRNNYFDVISCIESMTYAKERKGLFTEIYRMLKNNGRVIVADIFPKQGFIDKNNQDVANDEIIEREEFQSLLETIGYKNINFQDITINIMPSSRRLYIMSILANPIENILKCIGIKTDMLSLSITGAHNRRISLKKKLGAYLIFYAEK